MGSTLLYKVGLRQFHEWVRLWASALLGVDDADAYWPASVLGAVSPLTWGQGLVPERRGPLHYGL